MSSGSTYEGLKRGETVPRATSGQSSGSTYEGLKRDIHVSHLRQQSGSGSTYEGLKRAWRGIYRLGVGVLAVPMRA